MEHFDISSCGSSHETSSFGRYGESVRESGLNHTRPFASGGRRRAERRWSDELTKKKRRQAGQSCSSRPAETFGPCLTPPLPQSGHVMSS